MASESVGMVTYGNAMDTRRGGLWGIPMGVTLAGIPVVVLAVVLMVVQLWWWVLAVIGVSVVLLALLMFTRQGRTVYQRRAIRSAHRRATRRGHTVAVGGPAGKQPGGTYQLPGLMAPSELSEHVDPYGRPFALLALHSARHYTVVIDTHPDGDALVDQARIDSQVAHWGAWLAQLGVEDGIVGASVTVETAPDSGVRLRNMADAKRDKESPSFSREVAAAVVDELATGSPVVSTKIAVTFNGADGRGGDRGTAAMAEEIGNRLPELLAGLRDTGASTAVRACRAADIVDSTRTAYDPTVAVQIERARSQNGTGLTWAEAGPAFAEDQIDQYFHDRAVSRSWQMWRPPTGVFYSSVLRRLQAPTKDVLRKRVTMLYRPIPAGDAGAVIESEINNATWTGSQKQRPSARAKARLAYAQKAAQEEAQGAGLLRFGMIVTVTCASTDMLPKLDKVIPSLGNQAKLKLRPALGNQAVTFQAGLPLGVVLPEHSLVPTAMRDYL
ncbi:SCO6880 family protein [Isoptericola sp. NPDC056134]|uniref:SCO6880 family protein n=1 Tax=Isoptericola sp. NPDC056134 TaxID=3345723 RepID=UPI0035ED9C4E